MALRSPICTVVGHVDHGKTTLLDSIRNTAVTGQEAGGITQAIGASIIPLATIKRACGAMFPKTPVSVPGILFIDTPGHAAFTSLRKRGGSLADVAILIVDMHEGFKPQTREALEILKSYKTPFVVAANKLDLAPGFRRQHDGVATDIAAQRPETNTYIETKLYELVGVLSEYGFPAERFDRVESFQKQVAIVPLSAVTREGVPELLMVIVGLAQKFLEGQLRVTADGPGKGVILEVKEEQGFGTTLDVILYDGSLAVGDPIVVGTLGEPATTRIRALLEPNENTDLRDRKTRFRSVERVTAATGVKIAAPGLEKAVAGMPIVAATEAAGAARELETPGVLLANEQQGVIIKADTLGSIEALHHLLSEKNIPIHRASIGPVTKKDLAEAGAQPDPVIIAFNVDAPQADAAGVAIIHETVIYRILERYEQHLAARASEASLPLRPTKAEILRNHIFRQSNPLICGMHVLAGELRTGMTLLKHGKRVATVKEIQENKRSVASAAAGASVAVSLVGPTAGRQVDEGDTLYSEVTEDQFRQLRVAAKQLGEQERQTLREIAEQMRRDQPLWGV